jgi:hypothetical protein
MVRWMAANYHYAGSNPVQASTKVNVLDFYEKTTVKVIYPIGGFAPGFYGSKCSNCTQTFTGDKYARQCEPCAINAVNESSKRAIAELHKLRNALQKIKFSNDEINEILEKGSEKGNA